MTSTPQHDIWPRDAAATLIGRIDLGQGPTPVLVRDGGVYDMSAIAGTSAELIEERLFAPEAGTRLPFAVDALFAADPPARLLSPIDLQCIKAAGVTFAVSAIERVIEEQARGDPDRAGNVRARLESALGGSIRSVIPGSPQADALKAALIAEGAWSQYLEVAIGPDAEIFTKGPAMSSVGWGAEIGVRDDSAWNNPEPEIVLAVAGDGTPVGATLGNDVNLRDFEGRSALLLGKAKDNNAACAIGPFIRLFDAGYSMADVDAAEVSLTITGTDGYRLDGHSSMREISRPPAELIRQALSQHDYPDGFVLFLGTLFAPTQDRDTPGRGFTHKIGDEVRIGNSSLGTLVNRVTHCNAAPPWTMGTLALMRNLAGRGMLRA
ncbi:fumarylacetoacetate hydrolase family protein [Sphingomonas sp. PB2P19]|uniref:fumarylacetoacetate hydrolase family protein n=1 Tax=Sphingomonas rhamnosi TaxID=3096156 RepID=UPI002FCA4A43